MRTLHLFAGAGGGILGDILLGHTPVCAVELEDYRRKVLLQRQRDGILPRFPIWDDIKTFDGKPWKGKVDIVAGGFPCQDISYAGKGAGIVEGKRSSLWFEMQRVVREVGPSYVFVENSPALTIRGLETVLAGLAEAGFNAEWDVFSAAEAGANHLRERIFILAYANQKNAASRRKRCAEEVGFNFQQWKVLANANEAIASSRKNPSLRRNEQWASHPVLGKRVPRSTWESIRPAPIRMDDDVAGLLDRVAAIGDGQVPAVVELAWKTLYGRINL